MAHKTTSSDVAKQAGVSRAAVSLVLNGHGDGNIAPAKQDAIRAAARELGYTPNSVARSLRSQRTHTIGVVTDWIATSAFGHGLLSGAIEVAREAGYMLLVLDTHGDERRAASAYEVLLGRQVDGLMFAAMSLRPYRAPAPMREVPAVLTNSYALDGAVTSVWCDEVGGGRAAAEVLLDHGHRDIMMLSGTHNEVATPLRIQGYCEALSAAGIRPSEPVTAGWDIRAGYRAAIEVLSRPARPTGLICANDRAAVGAVLAARELGLAVPRDVSVVGYDDDENVAEVMVPALTTVAIPHRAMGEEGVRLLLSAIDSEAAEPQQIQLPCPLIERDSVAPPCG